MTASDGQEHTPRTAGPCSAARRCGTMGGQLPAPHPLPLGCTGSTAVPAEQRTPRPPIHLVQTRARPHGTSSRPTAARPRPDCLPGRHGGSEGSILESSRAALLRGAAQGPVLRCVSNAAGAEVGSSLWQRIEGCPSGLAPQPPAPPRGTWPWSNGAFGARVWYRGGRGQGPLRPWPQQWGGPRQEGAGETDAGPGHLLIRALRFPDNARQGPPGAGGGRPRLYPAGLTRPPSSGRTPPSLP